jgi:hypothetical protein
MRSRTAANTRAAGRPPGVTRTETQVTNAVATQSATITSGCDVRKIANVAAVPARSRATAAASSARRGATSRIASSTIAT